MKQKRGGGGGGMQSLVRQANQMQAKMKQLQEELGQKRVLWNCRWRCC